MNRPDPQPVNEIVAAILDHDRFLVATHVRPDGDAIGSLLAATFILRKLGKAADPYSQDAVPPAQQFLPGAQEISHQNPNPKQYDAAILVDCGGFDRVGSSLAETIRSIPVLINIDHHLNSDPFGDVYWVEPTASSTCEMLYELCKGLTLSLDADIATQLYTGLLTDTGSFRFANTSRRVLEIAADLVAAGADPAFIAQEVYDSVSPQAVRLLGLVLATVVFFNNNRLATAELTLEMFAKTDTSPVDSEGFINHLRSVKPVEMAVLFREDKGGIIHVSTRSKGNIDVAAFARKHGGGGHRHAAAFRIPGTLDSVRAKITNEAINYLTTV